LLRRVRGFRTHPRPDLPSVLQYGNAYGADMKTTLNIDDQLLTRARIASARERKTLKVFFEEALRLRLRVRCRASSHGLQRLPVFHGKSGLAPGIDPTSLR
jgi:hypothetical protein